ncbi:MAG: phage holin [Lachnospiraceae bacterium]|nr:phage holin [Lachnospiraceae bacterium]
MNMDSKTYNTLKFITQIILPAAAALYGTLAGIWGLPYGEAIVATIAAVDTFMGAVLLIDSKNYFKDKVIVPDQKEES